MEGFTKKGKKKGKRRKSSMNNKEKKAANSKHKKEKKSKGRNLNNKKVQKKFEKNKWQDLTPLVKKAFERHSIKLAGCSKDYLFMILEESPMLVRDPKNFPDISKVLDRIKWDPIFKGHDFNIAIKSSKFGIEEKPLADYLKSESLLHHVQYLRHEKSFKILWDKRDQTNILEELEFM